MELEQANKLADMYMESGNVEQHNDALVWFKQALTKGQLPGLHAYVPLEHPPPPPAPRRIYVSWPLVLHYPMSLIDHPNKLFLPLPDKRHERQAVIAITREVFNDLFFYFMEFSVGRYRLYG